MPYKFKGKLLKVVARKSHLPNGHISSLEIIEHPGAVLIIPFLDPSHIILLKQYRPVIEQYLYELPAGTLNPKETVQHCAHRELIEETGYETRSLKKLGKIFPVPGYSTEIIHIFRADHLKKYDKDDHAQDEDELLESKIMSLDEIKSLFKKGKILDAKTICALAYTGIL